jgi:hypothetical protein
MAPSLRFGRGYCQHEPRESRVVPRINQWDLGAHARDHPVPAGRRWDHDEGVFEVFRVVVTTLVVGSLATLVGYALAFVWFTVSTVVQARRRPTLADELDAVLAEILRA